MIDNQQHFIENGLETFVETVKQWNYVHAFIAKIDEEYYLIEEKIRSTFRKFNSNTSFENSTRTMPYDAFSHFTLHLTDDEYLLYDLQGSLKTLTDPQVHSKKY